jgi:hypothetical protein
VIRGEDGGSWAFTGVTADERCGVFKPDEPLPEPPARLSAPVPLPTEPLWNYSRTQRTRRLVTDGKKSFVPQHLGAGRWENSAGPAPWPFYGRLPEAPGTVIEVEGEKCVDILLAISQAAITHPGHNHTPEASQIRYGAIKDRVTRVIYIADNDEKGKRRAEVSQKAAAAAGVPFTTLYAEQVWPGIVETGSVDDVSPEEIMPAITAALAKPRPPANTEGYSPDKAGAEYAALLREERSGRDLAEAAAKIADQYKITSSDWYQIKQQADKEYETELQKKAEAAEISESALSQAARAGFTFASMLPAKIAKALATVTQTLPTDDLCATMAFVAAASGALKIGSTLCGNVLSNYKVPLNLFVVLIAPSGKKKSPVLRACARDPWEWVRADAAAANRQAMEDWEESCKGVDTDKPVKPKPIHPFITAATGEALSQQFGIHEEDLRRTGILLFKDELSSFFTGLDAYRSGNKKCDQAGILEAFEGTGSTELRVSRDSRSFERCHLSILGGIQPAVFEHQVAHKGDPDGFFARFLYCRLPDESKRMPLHATAEEVAELHAQEDYLKGIMLGLYHMPPVQFVLCDKAMAMFVELDYEAQELGGMAASDTAEGPVYGKRCANVLRVAGLLHLLKLVAGEAENDALVSVDTYLTARDIVLHLQKYAITQQRRIAANASPQDIASTLRLVHRVAGAIGKPVSPGEVRMRLTAAQRKTVSTGDIAVAFQELQALGFGSISPGYRSAPQFLPSGKLPVL